MYRSQFIKKIYTRRSETANQNKTAVIKELSFQTEGADYYIIELDGKEYRDVPCTIPRWLADQITTKEFQYKIDSKKIVNRMFIFQEGDSVNITYESGNLSSPKISLDGCGKKYKELKIVYI